MHTWNGFAEIAHNSYYITLKLIYSTSFFIFDLATQKKNAKLTHVEFNPVYPIIIVGDDR